MNVPVCVKDGRRMTCKKNGVLVEDGPYQMDGDMYECPNCGAQVIVGFGLPHTEQGRDPEQWAARECADVVIVEGVRA